MSLIKAGGYLYLAINELQKVTGEGSHVRRLIACEVIRDIERIRSRMGDIIEADQQDDVENKPRSRRKRGKIPKPKT